MPVPLPFLYLYFLFFSIFSYRNKRLHLIMPTHKNHIRQFTTQHNQIEAKQVLLEILYVAARDFRLETTEVTSTHKKNQRGQTLATKLSSTYLLPFSQFIKFD